MKKESQQQPSSCQQKPLPVKQQFAEINKDNQSSFHKQYSYKMSGYLSSSKEDIINKLQSKGFSYLQNLQKLLIRKIVKIGNFSVTYKVLYGYFSSLIHVYITDADILKYFKRNHLSSGRYGTVQSFQCQSYQVVAKVLSNNSQEDMLVQNDLIREVFLLKIASALGIGPTFIEIYGYDIIVLRDKAQFLMEKCYPKPIKGQKAINNLKADLLTLHQIGIIHGDIKNANIGWDKKRKKYVFLDFGLSRMIPQKIGQKKRTQFFGSFDYCYSEMRKAYILQDEMEVDLFYNDVFGLQESVKKSSISSQTNQNSNQISLIIQTNQNPYNWSDIVSFFQINFYLYQQNKEAVLQIFRKEQKLVHTLRKVVYKDGVINQHQFHKEFLEICRQKNTQYVKQYELESQQIDIIIFKSFMLSKSVTERYFKKLTINNLRTVIDINKFSDYWKNAEYMEQLFKILYLNISQNKTDQKLQAIELKKQIFNLVNELEGCKFQTALESYYRALVIFRNYFYQKKDLEKLFTICYIFQLLVLVEEVKKTQDKIYTLFISVSQDPQQYLFAIYQYINRKLFQKSLSPSLWQEIYLNDHLQTKQQLSSSQSNFINLINQIKNLKNQSVQSVLQLFRIIGSENSDLKKWCDQIILILQEPNKVPQRYSKFRNIQKNLQFSNRIYFQKTVQLDKIIEHNRILSYCPILSQIYTLRHLNQLNKRNKQQLYRVVESYVILCQQNQFYSSLFSQAFLYYYIINNQLEYKPNILSRIIQCIQSISFNFLQLLKQEEKCMIVIGLLNLYQRAISFDESSFDNKKIYENIIQLKIKILNKIRQFLDKQCEIQLTNSVQASINYSAMLYIASKIIEIYEEKQYCQVCLPIKQILEYSIKFKATVNFNISFHILRFIGLKCIQSNMIQAKIDIFREQYKYFLIRVLNQQEHSKIKYGLPFVTIMAVLNPKQVYFFFDLFVKLGDQLKQKYSKQSALAFYEVKCLMLQKRSQLQFIQKIKKWTLNQVSYNSYRSCFVAFCLQNSSAHFSKQQMQRLLKMCAIGASTISFYHKHSLVQKNILSFTKNKPKQAKRQILINERAYIRNTLRCSESDIIDKLRRKQLRKFVRLLSSIYVYKKLKTSQKMFSSLIVIKKKLRGKCTKLKEIFDCYD